MLSLLIGYKSKVQTVHFNPITFARNGKNNLKREK